MLEKYAILERILKESLQVLLRIKDESRETRGFKRIEITAWQIKIK